MLRTLNRKYMMNLSKSIFRRRTGGVMCVTSGEAQRNRRIRTPKTLSKLISA
jgi:hypothetical protein